MDSGDLLPPLEMQAPALAEEDTPQQADSDDADPTGGGSETTSWGSGKLGRALGRHALPDRGFEVVPLNVVRFARLLGVAALLLGLTRAVVVALDLEHDSTYGVDAFLRYDVNEVVLDLLFLFVAGGMHARPAADELGFAAIAACNAFLMSVLNEIPALQHSFSLFEMHCRWTFGTWAILGCFACVSGRVLLLHYRFLASQPALLRRALVQLLAMFILFWGPHLTDGDFHIHHWFYSWFVACQCSFTPWWSRATQAWFLGGYLNGIAIYGRDPILVCEAAFYRAMPGNGNCKFLEVASSCVLPGTNETIHVVEPPVDWWACTGDYH
jgi:hypothetical protein